MKTAFVAAISFGVAGLLVSTAPASELEQTEFEKKLIGKTWKDEYFRENSLSSECIRIGSQSFQQDKDLALTSFICPDNRQLNTISERIGLNSLRMVLIAFLFPKLQEGETLMSTGDCSLNGDTSTDFTALVRMGERDIVDWETGVIAAWIPNIKIRRYEPLATRNIVCGLPTPP